MRLMGKLFINGKIRALTGLSIGGSKTDVAIGDIDNCVIKTSEGVPYIPGSSLKGKIRSLLEKSEMEAIMEKNKKSDTGLCNCGRKDCKICVVFGNSGDKRSKEAGPTRLVIRDCHLTPETRRKMEEKEGEFRELELIYTESKWENVINRLTSRAEHPRQTERVPGERNSTLKWYLTSLKRKTSTDSIISFRASTFWKTITWAAAAPEATGGLSLGMWKFP